MLTDAEHREPDLVGQGDLLEQVAQPPPGIKGFSGRRIGSVLDKGVDADFHGS